MNSGTALTALTLASATTFALAFRSMELPLPFILGGMFGAAAASNLFGPMAHAKMIRRSAQLVIGAAVGGLLTEEALTHLAMAFPAMIAATLALNLAGVALAVPVARIAGVDRLTALLSCLPAGMSEMASLASEIGARAHVVATIHALRVVLLIALIPLWLGDYVRPADAAVAAISVSDFLALGALILVSALAAAAAAQAGMMNPWVVAPMALSLLFVAGGGDIPRMPELIGIGAQIAIGASLGVRFDIEAIRALPRATLAGIASTAALATIALLLLAPLLQPTSGLDRASIRLALVPGGLGEMIATAQALGLASAAVAAFHFTRSLFTNAVTPILIRRLTKRR